jgi:hypothetical protein
MTEPSEEVALSAAWEEAARDLGFRFTSGFVDTLSDGRRIRYAGLVDDFGAPKGALLAVYRRGHTLAEYPHSEGYFVSMLNPASYTRYDRQFFIDTLNDFGWFGPDEQRPAWYTGKPWT